MAPIRAHLPPLRTTYGPGKPDYDYQVLVTISDYGYPSNYDSQIANEMHRSRVSHSERIGVSRRQRRQQRQQRFHCILQSRFRGSTSTRFKDSNSGPKSIPYDNMEVPVLLLLMRGPRFFSDLPALLVVLYNSDAISYQVVLVASRKSCIPVSITLSIVHTYSFLLCCGTCCCACRILY